VDFLLSQSGVQLEAFVYGYCRGYEFY